MDRQPNTQYVLSLSYGKDSLACLEAIRLLGWPLDRIIHAEVWATDDIHADLPPMVEFKAKADAIILDRYGIQVEHVCAMWPVEREREREREFRRYIRTTYEQYFYRRRERGNNPGKYYGFPSTISGWCHNLKEDVIGKYLRDGETDLREAVLPRSEAQEEHPDGWGGDRRIPVHWNAERMNGMVPRAQDKIDSLMEQSAGSNQSPIDATQPSRQTLSNYGFPRTKHAEWCHLLKGNIIDKALFGQAP